MRLFAGAVLFAPLRQVLCALVYGLEIWGCLGGQDCPCVDSVL